MKVDVDIMPVPGQSLTLHFQHEPTVEEWMKLAEWVRMTTWIYWCAAQTHPVIGPPVEQQQADHG
jgi:hypothetical protein